MINREIKRNRFSLVYMAQKLQKSPSSIFSMLNRPTLQVQKLIELSEIFQYNFFREVAAMLPYTEPDFSVKIEEPEIKDDTEVLELRDRVKMLEMEVTILRQTLKDVISR